MTTQTVFILDDDVDFAEALAELLETRGYRCELAHRGEDAVERFRKEHYDIAFLDVRMPGMNGVESYLRIRELQPDARVYIMTAYSADDLLQQALNAGALGVLSKPLDLEGLIEKLEGTRLPERRVLVVDDDREFLNYARAVLESAGFTVVEAEDGLSALVALGEQTFDLVLLDVLMPELNGLQVYEAIRSAGDQLPVIFVTANGKEIQELSGDVHAFSIEQLVYKPIEPAELLALIEQNEKT